MLCMAVDGSGVLSVVSPQPTDLSTCQYVLLTPDEAGVVSVSFDAATAGAFFAFGFSAVVFMWFLGKGARGVLRPLDLMP